MKDERTDYQRREAAEIARLDAMCAKYPADVRRLYDLWRSNTDASDIAGQILRAAHAKFGLVELSGLYRLDHVNLAAALRIIKMFGYPSLLSDRGLAIGPEGEPLMTSAEVKKLLDGA